MSKKIKYFRSFARYNYHFNPIIEENVIVVFETTIDLNKYSDEDSHKFNFRSGDETYQKKYEKLEEASFKELAKRYPCWDDGKGGSHSQLGDGWSTVSSGNINKFNRQVKIDSTHWSGEFNPLRNIARSLVSLVCHVRSLIAVDPDRCLQKSIFEDKMTDYEEVFEEARNIDQNRY